MQWNSWYMFYSSLLFHKEVNFTLKDYFNQLFSPLTTIDRAALFWFCVEKGVQGKAFPNGLWP
ncbi:MAG: hypothetical protein AMK69_03380 [Nitrospira bacterium SG8_3]|nr:MAG: hypothetical protein AMK69_03380 [Nitrospira bacterium SG8_3]